YHTVLQMLDDQVEHTPLEDVRAPGPTEVPAPSTATDPARPPDVSAELQPAPADRDSSKKLVRIYLVCDRQDHPLLEPNRARTLRDHLLKLGFEVNLPLADDEGAQFSRDNRTKLKQCDAVLVYWGTARQGWFDRRLEELEQARGWRQGRGVAALGGSVAEPG